MNGTKPRIIPRRAGRSAATPTVLQMEGTECGAACWGSSGHYRRFVGLEELRLACGVSRDGARRRQHHEGRPRYGLAVKPFTMEPAASAPSAFR